MAAEQALGSDHHTGLHSCVSLLGGPVVDSSGQALGPLADIWIDVGSDQVAYGIIHLAAAPATGGDKRIAVPWQLIGIERAGEPMVLDLPSGSIEDDPGLGRESDIPTDPRWHEQNRVRYGIDRSQVAADPEPAPPLT